MSGNKGGGGTTTQNSEPWAPMQDYLKGIMNQADQTYTNGPGFATPFNANQQQGQNMALDYANSKLPSMIDPYQNWSQTMLQRPGVNDNPFGINPALQGNMNLFGPNSGATGQGIDANPYNINTAIQQGLNAPNSISQNPVLEQYAQAATRPMQQQLDLQTMPGIRSMFGGSQPGGGSRQGVAEGVARGLTNQGIGDTRANIYNNAYNQSLGQQANALNSATQNYGIGANRQDTALGLANQAYGQGLDAQGRALALYPQALQAGTMPSSIFGNVGDAQQANQNQQQTDIYKRLQYYSDLIHGVPSGTQTTVSQGGSGSTAMNVLGGATTGLGLLGMINPALAGLGALGGLFGNKK